MSTISSGQNFISGIYAERLHIVSHYPRKAFDVKAPSIPEKNLPDKPQLANKKKKMGKTVEEVYQDIKNMIYFGFLVPGQKIIYKDLALQLNVSSTPVIQALKSLERSNLVTYTPNKGYSVGELTIPMVEELFQVRELLEVNSVPLLIKNLNKENLKEIRNAFKQYSIATSPEKGRNLMLRDAQFHLKIIEFSGNKSIHGFLKEVLEQIYLRYRPEYLLKFRVDEALKEHKAIFNALSQGDTAETMQLLKEHIRKGKAHINRSLQLRNSILEANKGQKLEGVSDPHFLAELSDGKS